MCSVPLHVILRQHGVRKSTELEVKRWKFENRVPLPHCVARGSFTPPFVHCYNGNPELGALCYPFCLSFPNLKQRRNFLSLKSPRTGKFILFCFIFTAIHKFQAYHYNPNVFIKTFKHLFSFYVPIYFPDGISIHQDQHFFLSQTLALSFFLV